MWKIEQAFGARVEAAGDRVRHGLERERFRPFGAEEDRTLETELFERVLQRRGHVGFRKTVRHRLIRGVSVKSRGVWVILAARIRLHTHHDTNHPLLSTGMHCSCSIGCA